MAILGLGMDICSVARIQRILEGWQAQGREPRERYG